MIVHHNQRQKNPLERTGGSMPPRSRRPNGAFGSTTRLPIDTHRGAWRSSLSIEVHALFLDDQREASHVLQDEPDMGWRSASRPGDPRSPGAERYTLLPAKQFGFRPAPPLPKISSNVIRSILVFATTRGLAPATTVPNQGLNRPNRSGKTNYCKFIQPSRNAGAATDRGSPIGLFFIHKSARKDHWHLEKSRRRYPLISACQVWY
jgi:hypothetical protein